MNPLHQCSSCDALYLVIDGEEWTQKRTGVWTVRHTCDSPEACPMTGRSASVCDTPDHRNCPDLKREAGYRN